MHDTEKLEFTLSVETLRRLDAPSASKDKMPTHTHPTTTATTIQTGCC